MTDTKPTPTPVEQAKASISAFESMGAYPNGWTYFLPDLKNVIQAHDDLKAELESARADITERARREKNLRDDWLESQERVKELEAVKSLQSMELGKLRAKLAAKSEAYGRLIAEIEELTSAISSSRVVCIESATFYEFRVATKWVDKLEKRIEEFRVVDQSEVSK